MTTPSAARSVLLAELEAYEHLLFEPITQADLDSLYALYTRWQRSLDDSPAAIALCDALDDLIEACVEGGGTEEIHVEQAYLDLVATVHAWVHAA